MNILKTVNSKNGNQINLLEVPALNQESQIEPKTKAILIIGVVHGDEQQGKFLIENYLNEAGSSKNRMLFIPCLNPDGFSLNTRKNSNYVDINRNFPTENWIEEPIDSDYYGGASPSSEIETRFVIDIIDEYSPELILTIHSPYKVVNYDGPAKEVAEMISAIIDYPVSSDIGYPTPGSLGNYAGVERNIPIITLELDEEVDLKTLINPMNTIFNNLGNI